MPNPNYNNDLQKSPMPAQAPEIRNKNFEEVALGYDAETAVKEANRCLNCKNAPCVSGCPVNVKIPQFIDALANGEFLRSYEIIKSTNALPAVCGRVCPQENQCEGLCVRGKKGESVAIGRLERFAADYANEQDASPVTNDIEQKDIKVAVIGSGPSGLTCAGDLAKLGYKVTVFEAFHTAGGVLQYGIPQFRLPKEIVSKEIESLRALGVTIQLNMVIGKVFTVDELFEDGYKAVFIGTGAGLPAFMNIEGESLRGVYSANEFLTRVNLMKAYDDKFDTPVKKSQRVAVVGGGNVAMDSARCAKRLGAEVYIIYRRGEAEMPARAEEVHHAKEEGIIFRNLTNPTKILGTDEVTGIECVEMTLGDPDASGRRRPVEKEGSNFVIDVDCVIMAIGTTPNPLIKSTATGVTFNKRGCIIADENAKTTADGIYAGGDAVSGAATVINAMGAGKIAANSIHEYLQNM
ncbi:oxidoreductase [Clostridia bacterium]|nr:oxidoreductase [Clostridia bacterium]GHU73751.1 oxidoreductase [Clostridia bacterium]